MIRYFTRAGTAAALLLAASPLCAHTIVGNRVFPATLTIDDPGVNDELALPSFSYLQSANPDGTLGPISYSLGWEYAKTITPDTALSVGSAGFTWQRNPKAEGWANIETQAKFAFLQIPEHEFIISAAVSAEIGNTGSPQSASLPSDPFSTITSKLYIGKGFGDASADWVRPFAVTGEIDYSIPTVTINSDGSYNPTVLTYGATLQYSLLYENSFVHQLPDVFNRLIPAFEGIFSTPVANEGPVIPGEFSPYETTGVVGPSLYYIGQYFEIGVMAQVPINRASGDHVGALAVLDIFLDDVAPTSLGKPLFSAPLSPLARY
ncbi:MAG: hypothetical protein P4L68_02365 [Methylovirgula sp.]|nr:hypothetical protein [Methylovirgula sp.]